MLIQSLIFKQQMCVLNYYTCVYTVYSNKYENKLVLCF